MSLASQKVSPSKKTAQSKIDISCKNTGPGFLSQHLNKIVKLFKKKILGGDEGLEKKFFWPEIEKESKVATS